MLDPFQAKILKIITTHRTPFSYIAGGSALNRDFPRMSKDIDIFQTKVSIIDEARKNDVMSLEAAGYSATMVRELQSMREWVVSDGQGHSTKLQWTRDTSYLYYPPVIDVEFGYVLSFEDLAINKIGAASDRGTIRDFHDLAALDLVGVRPWLLALACMGKDAERSPEAIIDMCLRLLPQAGRDDEDPEYQGENQVKWPEVRAYLDRRLREDKDILRRIKITEWAAALPVSKETGRILINMTPSDLQFCEKHRATQTGSWPTIPALSSYMLRKAQHPLIAPGSLDLGPLLTKGHDPGP